MHAYKIIQSWKFFHYLGFYFLRLLWMAFF